MHQYETFHRKFCNNERKQLTVCYYCRMDTHISNNANLNLKLTQEHNAPFPHTCMYVCMKNVHAGNLEEIIHVYTL